jgi:molecular chaperone GrpE
MVDETRVEPAEAPGTGDPSGEAPATAADPLAVARRERDDYYDRLLRTTAEFDNYRRRIERERREQADQSVADLILDLLLILDDFERALEVASGDGADAYRKGVELIAAKLQDLLQKRGVRPIEVIGADFDPNVHQAVTYEQSPGYRDGQIVAELRRGYMMNDRLLRPAMVKVAKA